MQFLDNYPILRQSTIEVGDYSIVPIRFQDRMKILQWRNEQMHHLRQNKPLDKDGQDNYFKNIVANLFHQEKPEQLLFSYLKFGECIGYGGLVHINWVDKNAEISFIMDTRLESECFELHWTTFLSLIEKVAFHDLNLYKIFTYAFDIRPNLYKALEGFSFIKEAILKEHCLFNGQFKDVIIHSKKNSNYLHFRRAIIEDVQLYFKWLNDKEVRIQSYNSENVDFENHTKWFNSKLFDDSFLFLIFQNTKNENVGQIRVQKKENNQAIIGVSIDEMYRGNNYASMALKLAAEYFLDLNPIFLINAFIKIENKGSEKAFKNAGFKLKEIVEYENHQSFHYYKKAE